MLASKSRPQYGSIDTSNTNIRPLLTVLWQNTQELQNATHSLPYLLEIFVTTCGTPIYSRVQYNTVQQSVVQQSIVEFSTVQCSAAVVQLILLKYLKSNFLQFLEEASTGQCVGTIPQGPHTLHRDKMTPPPPPLLDCTILYFTLLYIGVLCVTINISIRYSSE